MRTHEWDRETFRQVLEEIQDRTQLSEADLAALAGRSRSQVNRWTRAENQPAFNPLRRLAAGLEQYGPTARRLGIELLAAAGYAPPEPVAHVSNVQLTVPPPTEGVRIEQVNDRHLQVDMTLDTEVTMADVFERLGDLSLNEQAMIANMQLLGNAPAEIGGAVLMLRQFNERRAARSKAPSSREEA